MATTGSPIFRSDDLPRGSAVRAGLVDLDHREVVGAVDAEHLRRAVEPSENSTSIEVASATTWALVAIWPSLVMTKPVPAACPPFSTTLMLTTPGRALLMRAETSAWRRRDGG